MQYRFMKDNTSRYSIDEMCECFGLCRSAYYAWTKRPVSLRQREDAVFKEQIFSLYYKSKSRYGHRPIYQHLQDKEVPCGRDRVLRLMKESNLFSVQQKGFKPVVTDSKHLFGYSANLLKELGQPTQTDQAWVADTTYIKTENGWCYLATVIDLYSRRVIGWSVSSHNNGDLVCAALKAANLTRNGVLPKGLIHHSDRGSTYASYDYTRLLGQYGIKQSMSAKGNCYDNAAQESFFGRYKSSSVRGKVFSCEAEVRSHVFEYIEVFYNRFRKHSSLGYQNPVEFEKNFCPLGGKESSLPACLINN